MGKDVDEDDDGTTVDDGPLSTGSSSRDSAYVILRELCENQRILLVAVWSALFLIRTILVASYYR